jgi:hypothetical protein
VKYLEIQREKLGHDFPDVNSEAHTVTLSQDLNHNIIKVAYLHPEHPISFAQSM